MHLKSLLKQLSFFLFGASLVVQMVNNPPTMPEAWVQSLGWEDPLETGMATHSSILVLLFFFSVFLPRESHEQRSLAGCGPWGRKELDRTEQPTLSLSYLSVCVCVCVCVCVFSERPDFKIIYWKLQLLLSPPSNPLLGMNSRCFYSILQVEKLERAQVNS